MKGKNEGTKLKALGLVMRVLAVGIWDNLVFLHITILSLNYAKNAKYININY